MLDENKQHWKVKDQEWKLNRLESKCTKWNESQNKLKVRKVSIERVNSTNGKKRHKVFIERSRNESK